MGLYSKNTISSISAEVAEVTSVEEESKSYFDSIEINDNFSGLVESSIQILENDNRMFDSLLELDFVTSMNESVLLEDATKAENMNSSKKQKILKQIEKVINSTKESINQESAKVVFKATALTESDSNTYNNYVDAIKKNGIEGFKGIKNFAFPNQKTSDIIDKISDISDLTKFVARFNKSLLSSESRQDVDETMDELELSIESITDDCIQDSKKAFVKEEVWNPDNKDLSMLFSFISGKAIVKSIEVSTKQTISDLQKIEDTVNKTVEEICKQSGEIQVMKMDAVYRATSAACRLALKKFNVYSDLEVREIAAYRRAIICCGRYALKLSKGIRESVELQEMLNYSAGESSDAYVFDKFNN